LHVGTHAVADIALLTLLLLLLPPQTVSKIGLAQPGKIMRGVTADTCERHLHQLHVCAPSKKGYTRLLYRMSMDFLDWVRYVPGIDKAWKSVAGQVRQCVLVTHVSNMRW
jgi:hypothetical protein